MGKDTGTDWALNLDGTFQNGPDAVKTTRRARERALADWSAAESVKSEGEREHSVIVDGTGDVVRNENVQNETETEVNKRRRLDASITGMSGADSVSNSILTLFEMGCPADHLAVGVAMYGRSWSYVTNTDGNRTAKYRVPFLRTDLDKAPQPPNPKGGCGTVATSDPTSNGSLDYWDIEYNYWNWNGAVPNKWAYFWDDVAKVPVLKHDDHGFITYTDEYSAKHVLDFANAMQLRGAFFCMHIQITMNSFFNNHFKGEIIVEKANSLLFEYACGRRMATACTASGT